MGEWLIGALALMLIFEGLLPLLSPARWRQIFQSALRLSDGQLRFVGLTSILIGLAIALLFLG
jgi:uncharacterized protein YjeT (DUF2065 family)